MVANDQDADWDDVSHVISSQYRKTVLKQLAVGPATPSQIDNETGVSISHVSRALGELRERELVELLVSEDRKKGRVYGITDQGADLWGMVKEMDDGNEGKELVTDGGVVEQQQQPSIEEAHAVSHARQSDNYTRIMMLVGSFGGAVIGMIPIVAYLGGAMTFEVAALFQIGFIAMCVSMGLSGVMLNE